MTAGRLSLTRFAWLSIATALVTMGLKATAYLLTGSVGLLSDALESGVNLAAAIVALVSLTVAAQPPDAEHAYGHSKAEYFSSALEGVLIIVAGATIMVSAVERLLHPKPLQQLDLGLAIAVVAALLNFVVARILLRAGREHESATLEADAQHLLSDVWTSVGVVAGVGIAAVTGWEALDPVVAIIVAAQIGRTGYRLTRNALMGLLDTALPDEEMETITDILQGYASQDVTFHALRTRRAGARRFVSVHIQVPGTWTVQQGHTLLEEIEGEVRRSLPRVSVFTHLEPAEDPVSWDDVELTREEAVGE